MATGSQARQDSKADRKRLQRIEVASLGILLLRRRRAIQTSHPETALVQAVSSSVLVMRQTAREFGRDTIAERFFGIGPVDPATRLADATRAHQLARSHVEHVKVELAKARAEAAADPWKAAIKETEWRAKTIAATETATVASEERLDAAREAAAAYDLELFQEWNAEGEACPECSSMDGETVPIDASFSNGLEPGSAHPHCACWREILTKTNQRAA